MLNNTFNFEILHFEPSMSFNVNLGTGSYRNTEAKFFRNSVVNEAECLQERCSVFFLQTGKVF